ncbi:hypothetical protein GCM10029978_078890 [Actinoallomurus acanthiterrae]
MAVTYRRIGPAEIVGVVELGGVMSEPPPSGRADAGADPGAAGPAKVNVRESVFQTLKTLLMDHDLEPGTRLSIDGLARRLEVSQTPVREALARCESEGLVVRGRTPGISSLPCSTRPAWTTCTTSAC